LSFQLQQQSGPLQLGMKQQTETLSSRRPPRAYEGRGQLPPTVSLGKAPSGGRVEPRRECAATNVCLSERAGEDNKEQRILARRSLPGWTWSSPSSSSSSSAWSRAWTPPRLTSAGFGCAGQSFGDRSSRKEGTSSRALAAR